MNKNQKILSVLLAGLVTSNVAFSRVITDDSKRVITIVQEVDENGNSISTNSAGATVPARILSGEFRYSPQTGYDIQGLYVSKDEGVPLRKHMGDSTLRFPTARNFNSRGQTREEMENSLTNHAQAHFYPYATDSDSSPARDLATWLKNNTHGQALYTYKQTVTVNSNVGQEPVEIIFNKIINPEDPNKGLYNRPTTQLNPKTIIVGEYYVKGVSEGIYQADGATGANGANSGFFNYQVRDLESGNIIFSERVDTNGAYDSQNAQEGARAQVQCMYYNYGEPCRPSPMSLRKIMSDWLAEAVVLNYYYGPEVKFTPDPNEEGAEKPKTSIRVTKRELVYNGCAVKYINEGVYSTETTVNAERWIVFWSSIERGAQDIQVQMTSKGKMDQTKNDNYAITMYKYINGQDTAVQPDYSNTTQTGDTAPTQPAAPFDRARAQLVSERGDEFIEPSTKVELVRAGSYSGTIESMAPLTITGNANAIRVNKARGTARTVVQCTPEGNVEFFFGSGTPEKLARMQYKWEEFTSPLSNVQDSFKASGCTTGQAKVEGDEVFFTGLWANSDASAGNAVGGAGCGTTFVAGRGDSVGPEDPRYCHQNTYSADADADTCSKTGPCTHGGTFNPLTNKCTAPKNEYRSVNFK